MADLVSTEAAVAVIFPIKARIHTGIAAVAITAGEAVFIDSSGDVDLADASVAGTATARGIALESAGAGQAVDFCERGWLYGFTLSQAYSAAIYLSNTAGAVGDVAGVVSVLCGRVVAMTDKDRTKVLAVDFPI